MLLTHGFPGIVSGCIFIEKTLNTRYDIYYNVSKVILCDINENELAVKKIIS
jgi:hypothetical protein